MACLKKNPSGNYDAILTNWDKKTKTQKQKRVNLNTRDENTAKERMKIAEQGKSYLFDERDREYEVSFPWQNKEGEIQPKEVHLMLEDIAGSFLQYQKNTKGLRDTSLEANKTSISQFLDCIKNINIKDLSVVHIDVFTAYLRKKTNQKGEPLSLHTINNRLRVINTFLIWTLDREYIDKKIKVSPVETEESQPIYISEKDYNRIMEHKDMTNRYKRAWKLYWETGMRLQEPFHGYIQGDWYIVPASKAKGKRIREIRVNEEQKETILFLQELWSKNPTKDAIKWYSKRFKKYLRSLDIKDRHLHCMRHSYAVRRIVQGITMKHLALELGHKYTSTTDKYADYKQSKIERDFPSLFDAEKSQPYTNHIDTIRGFDYASPR